MLSRLAPLAMLPGFALCGLLVHFCQANMEEVRASFRADEVEAAKESIALSLMGQVQFTAQSLVWMKTLEYLHNGVAFRMPTNAEEERGFRAQNAVDVASGLDHQDGVPMALNRELDWRGPVGELHRTILPHMTRHSHSDPVELIPWYELALKLNPNIERLYTLGAFFMADFAQEPQRALTLLEAGVEANPWTYEVRGALGRLLFEKYAQLGLEPEQAYERAAEVLGEAVKRGREEKERLDSNKDHFGDYEKQLFRESYLFLARSLTELERFEEAIAVCEEGLAVTKHNHLKVQKRITTRLMKGEEPGEASPSSSRKVVKLSEKIAAHQSGNGQAEVDEEARVGTPISVTLGIPCPEGAPALEERPLLRKLIEDIRSSPYESLAERLRRIDAPRQEVDHAIHELTVYRFISSDAEEGPGDSTADTSRHFLTPIGLYVAMDEYGFDFWERMAEQARQLEEQGFEVDLHAATIRKAGEGE